MLSGVRIGHNFQVETLDTMCYLVNWSLTLALVEKIPHEVCTTQKPSLKHLNFFGRDAYVHVPKKKMSKLDNVYEKCRFIGYNTIVEGFKF